MENRERREPPVQEEENQKEVIEGPRNFEEATHNLESYLEKVAEIIKNPERYIDKGGAGAVYELEADGRGLCVKVLEDRQKSVAAHLMDIGNNVQLEARIQMKLSGIQVAGVRAPEVYHYTFTNKGDEQKDLIIMERLEAVGLQHILNGSEEFPADFDPEVFTDALSDYLDHMHDEVGIVHSDLAPRNVMVDKTTGLPRLIDFGRSSVRSQHSEAEYVELVDRDDEEFDAIAEAIFNLTDNE